MKKIAVLIFIAIMLVFQPNMAQAATNRPEWVQNQIYQFNHQFATRSPEELNNKMQKMAASQFSFYRGTTHIFYHDMATLPESSFVNDATSSVWLQGDMHLQNMGAFADNTGAIIFDSNDFDEGYLGPYIWDLRRLAVSIILAGKENKLSISDRQEIILTFLDAYLDKMADFQGDDSELNYTLNVDNTSGVVKEHIQKAMKQTRNQMLDDLTLINTTGERVFQTKTKLQPVASEVYNHIAEAMNSYIDSIPSKKRYDHNYYRLKDIRQKLKSGTGSLGRYRYYLLIEGPTTSISDDVVLGMKQETSSAVAIAASNKMPPSVYDSQEGKRVAMTTQAMLQKIDVLIGHTNINSDSYIVYEKQPSKVDFDYKLLTTKAKFLEAMVYQGKALAKDHALADRDYNPNIIPANIDKEITNIVAGNRDKFKDEIVKFAIDYAAQVENDYNSFVSAYQSDTPLY